MAWLEEHPTSGHFKVCFRSGGKKVKKTIKTTDRQEAEGVLLRFKENLGLLERGRLDLPPDADLATFLLSDGKLTQRPHRTAPPTALTLVELRDRYVEAHSSGAMEVNSLDTVKMHLRHFIKSLGEKFPVQTLAFAQLQEHVSRRAKKKGLRKKPLSPVTLRKEMATLRACWNWGVHAGLLKGPFPNRGLTYPKADEKPPFQTWGEIERQIGRGGLSRVEQLELWDCLFLTLPEVDSFLADAKKEARHGFLYPMFCFAAHTGVRRSELIRASPDFSPLDLRPGP